MRTTANYSQKPVLWRHSARAVAYLAAEAEMDRQVAAIQAGGQETAWLLEHPPLYTAGTSARAEDLLEPARFPVFPTPRGGQYTYHGPGQRVVYLMLDLAGRKKDVRLFVRDVEAWIMRALTRLDVESFTSAGRVGVWTKGPSGEAKIAAIGIRIKKWITFHGVALNVDPDLTHFSGIVPCGIADPKLGVTSLKELGKNHDMAAVDAALRAAFEEVFGPTCAPVGGGNPVLNPPHT